MIRALFALLGQKSGPVLAEYPHSIDDVDGEPLVCALPPRMNSEDHPAVDEAKSIRSAYDRAINAFGNRIGSAREIGPDQVADAIVAFAKIADGTDWQKANLPGNPMRVAQDVRGYYQTAALVLAEHSPGAWAGENWFYNQTETGKLMLNVRTVLKESGAPRPLWFYLSPGDRPV